MKIIQLTAHNVKRLRVVEITPDPVLTQITGKNESGKSSVLDSIWWALAGKDVIQDKPIRDGEETATIRLNLGDIIVKRTFERAGDTFKTTLLVLNPAGAAPGTPDKKLPKWESPQAMLDAILGELTFDPLKFAKAKPREQLDELRKIAKVTIDIDALNLASAADFKRRTDINRDAKAKRSQADGIVVPADTPADPVDERAIIDKMTSAADFNAKLTDRQQKRDKAALDAATNRTGALGKRTLFDGINSRADAKVAELQRQIEVAEKERADELTRIEAEALSMETTARELDAKLAAAPPLPAPMSVVDLRTSLDAAQRTNAAIDQRKKRDAIAAEAKTFEDQAESLTSAMEARERQITDAIKAAEMPIAGLGFGKDCILYNGIPFEQSSSAARLRVSASIAMASNPKLRVIRIQDGSLLDDDGIKIIAEMAAEKDFQVWMERVDSSGKIGVYMEDGEVKSVEAKA